MCDALTCESVKPSETVKIIPSYLKHVYHFPPRAIRHGVPAVMRKEREYIYIYIYIYWNESCRLIGKGLDSAVP